VDSINSVWQAGIIAFVAGAIIGVLAYRLLAPSVKQAAKTKSELDMTRKELNSYQDSVNSHFDKTSELVNDLTQNYVKVYRHLAEGAQTLSDSSSSTSLLGQNQDSVLISVDDEIDALDTIAGGEFVDSALTQDMPVEDVDEHSAPFTGTSNDETAPEIPGDDLATTDVSKSTVGSEQPADISQPVLDVSKIEEAETETEAPVSAPADIAVHEPADSARVKPVTH